MLIDHDRTIAIGLHADGLEPQAPCCRSAPGGEEDKVGVKRVALEAEDLFVSVGFDLGWVGIGVHRDALRPERLGERLPQVAIEAAEWQRLAVHEVHVRAEAGEDTGKLHRDIARADDRDALGHLGQEERVVRNDSEFSARDVEPNRMAAGGDDDILGGDAFATDVERVGIDEGCAGFEDGGAGGVEETLVDTVEAADLLVLRGDQLVPIMRAFLDRPAEAGGIVCPGAILAGLHQQLLRDAADVDTSAPPEAFLGYTNACAVACGDARATDAGGAAADNEEIKIDRKSTRLNSS